ncbi:MAG TPA: deoxyribonuclease IV [Lachnospiraceae bacterium]|nr:deoxyribonuclease IV [Lachnospiraceae bacterium]
MIYLGSHVSFKAPNYFKGAIEEALSYGANACMIYTGPPSNTRRVDVSKLKIEEAKDYMAEHNFSIDRVIVHAPYIINLANTVKPEIFELATEFLAKEITRTAAMGSHILVLHPGSHVKAGEEVGIKQIICGLNMVLDDNDDDVYIALETMAGKGSELGKTFEEIKQIYDGVHKKDRLRVCFDTCHVNDAGYDLVGDYDGVFAKFDEVIGLDQIAVFHINDSKNPLGAHKDRHANIGEGEIGYDTLHRLVHDERFAQIPKILETPWRVIDGEGTKKNSAAPYKEEIAWLREPIS